MIGDFHFLRPLWWLALLPALVVWWRIWRRQAAADSWRRIMDPHLLEHLLVGQGRPRRLRPIHLLLLVWVVTIAALAGPTWRQAPAPFADEQAGLVVLLKVSKTMNATDVQPSRLERAKHKLHDLLELRQGASTGLIVYSGSAHLVMPLTRDDRIIGTMAADLSPEIMPSNGDALAQALGQAEKLLLKAGIPGSVLVIADTVAATQIPSLSGLGYQLPVQFLACQSPTAPVDKGLRTAAAGLDASVTALSIDSTDVERIARRAQSELRTADSPEGNDRWHDSGYALLPLIATATLMWSRKGWVVR